MESTTECITIVPEPRIVLAKAKPTHPNAIYRVFIGNDAECWARYDKDGIVVISQHAYHFEGLLSGSSSFHLNQEKSLDRVLAEGTGTIINRKVLPLCDESYDSGEKFPEKDQRFAYTDEDQQSADGKTYKLFQDYDQGARGWAILTAKSRSKVKVIFEDHNDNVRDRMLSPEFLTELGLELNLKYLRRENRNFYKRKYRPTKEDFKKDFHIEEDGKRKKA